MGAAIPVMHYTGMAAAGFTLSGIADGYVSRPSAFPHWVPPGITRRHFYRAWTGPAHILGGQAIRCPDLGASGTEVAAKARAYLAEAQKLSHTGELRLEPVHRRRSSGPRKPFESSNSIER